MRNSGLFIILFALIAAAAGAAAYFAYDDYFLKQSKAALESEISQATKDSVAAVKKFDTEIGNLNTDVATLSEALDSTRNQLASTTAERNDLEAKYNNMVNDLGSQVSAAQNKIGSLEKLSQTDPELLKKYSKVYFLNENYAPAAFAAVDSNYGFNPGESYKVYDKIWPFLKILLSTASQDGINLKIVSAYRSFSEQSSLKSSYKVTYGTGANKFSADQGYSEHQMGTAVDFTTPEVGDSFTGFEKTDAYQWLRDNAYTYGFILSYPRNNSYYQFEPWHWRFVGRALAQKLHDENKNFYDLDQREIDQYLISFFD